MGTKGRMTLPVDRGMDEQLKELAEKWGVDAVRNSDGTDLPENIKEMGLTVYSTLCMVRADQKWAKGSRERLPQKYLISEPVAATSHRLVIKIMRGHFREQFEPDAIHDPKKWWEVMDRTTGQVVKPSGWKYDRKSEKVTIENAVKYHVYTVSFLVFSIWDTTSMYNHITNNWTTEHALPMDARHPETRRHLRGYLKKWLKDNPDTDVVRFTSLIYHFTNNLSDQKKSKFIDWNGYHDVVSIHALNDFARKKGYRLRPEDITQGGYMNDTNKVPTRQYLDWIDYNNETVTDVGREWVELVHKARKKAMMFYCDHHIGTEPYGRHFGKMKMDGLVNPCGSGSEARRIADIPYKVEKEVRLYPYLFPLGLWGEPIFAPGGDPKKECAGHWIRVRRALAQKLVDRIGFGGYPSLAVKYPDFVDYVAYLSDEFRSLHDNSGKKPPARAPFKVGVLNAWGRLRSWIGGPFTGGVYEALSGMSVEVEFLNFDDVRRGALDRYGVIINAGEADTAWTGGHHWADEKVVTAIRDWVYRKGGGMIGIGEPSAHPHGGRNFQLFDVFGVDRREPQGMNSRMPVLPTEKEHFITEDSKRTELGVGADGGFTVQEGRKIDLGPAKDRVYVISDAAKILLQREVDSTPGVLQEGGDTYIAVNTPGNGRAVYFAGFDYSPENTRLLLRALYWAAKKENAIHRWFAENPRTECVAYPAAKKFIVMNNSYEPQQTTVHVDEGVTQEVALGSAGSRWFEF